MIEQTISLPITGTYGASSSVSYVDTNVFTAPEYCSISSLHPVETDTKDYIDEKLKKQAEKTYDIISKLIQWNVDKEEFVNLLLSEEE